MMKHALIAVPPIPFRIATEELARRCPRCRKSINQGEGYLDHAEGRIHVSCLRTGAKKVFRGRVVCERK
jgi:hypothetical protein